MKILKSKKKTTLLIALCLTMLFALSTSAFAFDTPEMECMPRPEPPKFRHCMPDRPYCVYFQDLDDVEEFGECRWFNQDFGWQHNVPFYYLPMLHIVSAKLRIKAFDVDADYLSDPEMDEVFADGVSLGYLEGKGSEWSTTEFDVPVELIANDGLLDVWLDIDSSNDSGYQEWCVEVGASELEVICQCGHFRWRRIIICD